jgi:hypothetical protein
MLSAVENIFSGADADISEVTLYDGAGEFDNGNSASTITYLQPQRQNNDPSQRKQKICSSADKKLRKSVESSSHIPIS